MGLTNNNNYTSFYNQPLSLSPPPSPFNNNNQLVGYTYIITGLGSLVFFIISVWNIPTHKHIHTHTCTRTYMRKISKIHDDKEEEEEDNIEDKNLTDNFINRPARFVNNHYTYFLFSVT